MKIIDSLKKKLNLDYEKISRHFAVAVDLIFILVLALNLFHYLPSYWNITYVFYFVVFMNTLWIMFKIKNIPEDKRDKNPLIYIFSYLFLLTLVIFTANQFLKNQVITDWMPYLTALSIGFGFLTFYAHRNKVEKDIEDEKTKEEKKEKERKEEFSVKFPRINKIWGLRSIVKWMYKEGWGYSLALVGIVVLGFVLRIWGALSLPIQADEWIHVTLLQNNLYTLPSGLIYIRGFLFTFFAAIIKIFLKDPFLSIRISSIFFGIGVIILSYKFSKRFLDKKFSLIAALVICLDVYLIAFSKYGRFYEQFYFFSLLSFYFLYKFSESYKLKTAIGLIFSLTFLVFSQDVGVIIFFPFWIFLLIKQNKKKGIGRYIKTTIPFIISGLIYLVYYFLNKFLFENSTLTPKVNEISKPVIGYIFNNLPYYLSFFGNYFFWFIIIGISFLFCFFNKKNNSKMNDISLFIFILTLAILTISYLIGIKNIRLIVFLFPIMWIISTFLVRSLLAVYNSKTSKVIIIILMILALSSLPLMTSQYIETYQDYNSVPIYKIFSIYQTGNLEAVESLTTHLFWTDYRPEIDFINKNKKPGDIIVSSTNFDSVSYYLPVDYNVNYYLSLFLSYSINGTYYDMYRSTPIVRNLEDYKKFNLDKVNYWFIEDQFFKRHADKEVAKKILAETKIVFSGDQISLLYDHNNIEPFGVTVRYHSAFTS